MATRLAGLCAERWDALVIGAGPAGGVAGAVLAGRGMRTLLVDRREFPRGKVCGGCLAPAGARALRGAGLGGVVRETGGTTAGVLRMVARGESARLSIEPYITVERSRFDAAIVGAACARGAVFAGGVRARVGLDDAVELEIGDERALVRPGVVIVADGLGGSALSGRDEFAWRVARGSRVGVGAVLGERPEHAGQGEITMVCGRGGYVGAAPLGGGEWALAAAVAPWLVRERGPAGAIAAVLGESGIRPPALARGALHGAGALTRRRRRVARGRVLVVGDAAGYVQPLTGEGMSWAIVCAAGIGGFAEAVAEGADVERAWSAECARLLRWRRVVCRGVCAGAAHPGALAVALRAAGRVPGAGWASRRLCWGSA